MYPQRVYCNDPKTALINDNTPVILVPCRAIRSVTSHLNAKLTLTVGAAVVPAPSEIQSRSTIRSRQTQAAVPACVPYLQFSGMTVWLYHGWHESWCVGLMSCIGTVADSSSSCYDRPTLEFRLHFNSFDLCCTCLSANSAELVTMYTCSLNCKTEQCLSFHPC
jgi:hypothetical protein